MSAVEKIDTFLIEKIFEKFSHWTQKMFGITCVEWAGLCLLVQFILKCIQLIKSFFYSEMKVGVGFFVSFVIINIFFQFVFFMMFLIYKSHIWEDVRMGMKNRQRFVQGYLGQVLRVACAFLAGFPGPKGYDLSFAHYVFLVSFIFFTVCTPLPPSKSKLRQDWEAFKSKLSEAFNPSPEPAMAPAVCKN
jgi:formate hydrogenlyase subunit 3/multisubunit Na+/H+ antiporter MnhD subunit